MDLVERRSRRAADVAVRQDGTVMPKSVARRRRDCHPKRATATQRRPTLVAVGTATVAVAATPKGLCGRLTATIRVGPRNLVLPSGCLPGYEKIPGHPGFLALQRPFGRVPLRGFEPRFPEGRGSH